LVWGNQTSYAVMTRPVMVRVEQIARALNTAEQLM
jgi:hypothetical protein